MPALQGFRNFNINDSDVVLWTFKKHWSKGNDVPIYNGHWVQTTKELDDALKAAVSNVRDNIDETLNYGLLAQNNENSALTISLEETYANLIIAQSANPTEPRKAKKIKDVNNAEFYVVKMTLQESSIFCVRRTDHSWKTRKAINALSAVFNDDVMTLETGTSFTLSKYFDFFIVGDTILVTNKPNFESLLSFKQAHIDEFTSLQEEEEFVTIFSDLKHIVEFVGTNKIQLRRISAIRQKGHYKNDDFMARLRQECTALGFNILFDDEGRMIPTPESCRDIFRALLDHRLDSRLSRKLYDVENAEAVA